MWPQKIPPEILKATEELKKTATRPIGHIVDEKVFSVSNTLNKNSLSLKMSCS